MSETNPYNARLRRFSSRLQRLGHVYLKDQLQNAKSYRRIAGYFRSSIFELVDEEISSIDKVQIVCNSDLDPNDIRVAQSVRDRLLKEKWNETPVNVDALLHRKKYRRLYDLLSQGNLEIRVVGRNYAPFLHGKAGIIEAADGHKISFIGSLNETRQGWDAHYELLWEDSSKKASPGQKQNLNICGTKASHCRTSLSKKLNGVAIAKNTPASKTAPNKTSPPPAW